MFSMKRKTLVMVSLVVLLVITGYLNYQYNESQVGKTDQAIEGKSEKDKAADITVKDASKVTKDQNDPISETSKSKATANFFVDFRSDRDKTRNQEIEYLNSIIENKATDKDTLKDAQQQKIEIARSMEKEVTIEGLVKAKGFSDVVVTLHKGSVNVVVDEPQLNESQVAKILDIVRRESGEKAENIKIIPAN